MHGERELAESLRTLEAEERYERLFIGNLIKKLRKKNGLSQNQLAEQLKTTQSVIARIEAGKQNLTLHALIRIARIFGKKVIIKIV